MLIFKIDGFAYNVLLFSMCFYLFMSGINMALKAVLVYVNWRIKKLQDKLDGKVP